MIPIDMVNRDPNGLNNYVHVQFEDVLAEPIGAHSADCVWRNSFKCFECTRRNCYKCLTFLCGICIAFFWGCKFACLSCYAIWCCTPYLRALHIMMHPVKKAHAIMLSVFCGTCAETAGLVFSRIHVTNSQGPPPKPLGGI